MKLSGLWIATHLLAVALAWLMTGRMLEKSTSESSNPSSGRVSTKSGTRAAATGKAASSGGVLAPWLTPGPDPAIAARLKEESLTTLADSIFAPIREIELGELMRLVSERKDHRISPVMRAFRSLVLTDPDGVREWLGNLNADDKSKFSCLISFSPLSGDSLISSAIPDDQLDSWRGTTTDNQWIEREQGRRAGTAGDTAWLGQQIRKMDDPSASRIEISWGIIEAVAHWPTDRVSELVGLIKPHIGPAQTGISRLIERLPPGQRLAFIDSLSSSGKTNATLDRLKQNAALAAVGADHAERMKVLSASYGDRIGKLNDLLVRSDVNRLLTVGELPADDPLHGALQRVRDGEMKADELLRDITARLGPLAAGNEKLIRDRVVDSLLKTAPAAAVELMADTPLKEVQDKVFALRFDAADFEAASVVLRAREPEVPGQMQARFSFWGHKSVEGLSRYGDAYVSWALAMPRSLERDLVLSAIAVHVEKDHPDWAARLRSEKSFQSGWRPGMK